MVTTTSFWKRCSSCKEEIGFSTIYQVCSVSTCTRKRTGMVFCSVGCWEMHLPMMRHREAFAVEMRSPSMAEWQRELEQEERSERAASSAPLRPPVAPSSAAQSAPARPPAAASPVRVVTATPPTSALHSASVASASPARLASTPAHASEPVRQTIAPPASDTTRLPDVREDDLPRDILIVASKLKQYIRARSGMNTSDGVMQILSDHLRAICRQAIRNAAQDGRKTVLDRDIPRPPSA